MRFGLPQDASMMIPVFLSFIGILIVTHACARRLLNPMNAFLAVALLIAFSPTVEWATYFMTDVTSGFLWITHLLVINRCLRTPSRRNTIFFILLLMAGLSNREQHILMVLQLAVLFLLLKRHRQFHKILRGVIRLFFLSSTVSISFILGWQLLHQSTLLDNITYLHNSYGLVQHEYTPLELLRTHATAIVTAHRALFIDLVHHRWWAVVFSLGIFEMARTTLKTTASQPRLCEILHSSAA